MTHQLDADDFFIHRIQQFCAEARMNFFLVEPLWADGFLQNLIRGQASARVLLNMHSEHHRPDDLFHRLVRLAEEMGIQVIDPPSVALAAFDKAALHPRLAAAGIAVPETRIVAREEAGTFRLSAGERDRLGSPWVIKPNLGYGRRGLVLEATSEADLQRSIEAWPNPFYLLQRRVVPRQWKGRPAYFRVYHVFGETWSCWWDFATDHYEEVRGEEVLELGLGALDEIVRRIAQLTGMNFFSSEVALTAAGEFVVIDYVNDQCHLLSQSASPRLGVPDRVVEGIACRIVAAARGMVGR